MLDIKKIFNQWEHERVLSTVFAGFFCGSEFSIKS